MVEDNDTEVVRSSAFASNVLARTSNDIDSLESQVRSQSFMIE